MNIDLDKCKKVRGGDPKRHSIAILPETYISLREYCQKHNVVMVRVVAQLVDKFLAEGDD